MHLRYCTIILAAILADVVFVNYFRVTMA